jgi:DtxR family Mn-dependent transcriptional regulator
MYGVIFYPLAASAVVFLGMLFFSSRHGRFWSWLTGRTRERILIEDALKHIFSCELNNRISMVESVAGSLSISANNAAEILAKMQSEGLLRIDANGFRLTPAGRDYAVRVVRAHRLWERFLADKAGFPETEWHRRADRREHSLSSADADALSSRLGHPTHDPHGDPIPTPTGDLVSHGGKPLTAMSAGELGQIVHIEDEPERVYAQLVADGLRIDMLVRMMEASPYRVRFWAEGEEHVLSPVGAASISIVRVPQDRADLVERLADLKPGECGKVVDVSRACRRDERRRWMDLGILPGTVIKAEIVSPSGDPTAYRIRGALIALRTEQARLITVRPIQGEGT